MHRVELLGQTFGRLRVIGPSTEKFHGRMKWECVCECGTTCIVPGERLRHGTKRSCGCLYRESRRGIRLTHGGKSSKNPWPEYAIWRGMIQRCHRPKTSSYPNYGGRGIKVCTRWRKSFAAFIEDMGRRPAPELTLDRRDNNQGYFKTNCHWTTKIEQANNKRNVLRMTINGITKTLRGWSDVSGIPKHVLIFRHRQNWPEGLFLAPPGMRRKNQCGTLIEYGGKKLGIESWATELGLPQWTLRRRLTAGRTLAEVIAEFS